MKTKNAVPVSNRIGDLLFEEGEVYLFHPTDAACPAESSLWGVFDRRNKTQVYLESSASAELRDFVLYGLLPIDYRYARLATRTELRDYFFALSSSERSRH